MPLISTFTFFSPHNESSDYVTFWSIWSGNFFSLTLSIIYDNRIALIPILKCIAVGLQICKNNSVSLFDIEICKYANIAISDTFQIHNLAKGWTLAFFIYTKKIIALTCARGFSFNWATIYALFELWWSRGKFNARNEFTLNLPIQIKQKFLVYQSSHAWFTWLLAII